MVSRKLSDLEDEDDLQLCMEGRTLALLETRPPSSQSPLNTDQQPQPQPPPQPANQDQEPDPETELTLYSYDQHTPLPPQLPLQPPPAHATAPRRNRRKPSHAPRNGKSPIIIPPYVWATDHRAHVHSLKYLTKNQIETISGDVECKRCQQTYQIDYNLEAKYKEVVDYVVSHSYEFHDRAPPEWMKPVLPKCNFCHKENCVKPVVKKKKSINWLFLFLGQMLGCCTLAQLKYFCKHTGNHRTGAKDRVLFLTYVELGKQVNRPIDEPALIDHREQID